MSKSIAFRHDLREDPERDVGRRVVPEVEPDRGVDAGHVGLARARLAEALEALGMRPPATERPDIPRPAAERRRDCRVVELRVVGQSDDVRALVDAGPVGELVGVGKPLAGQEGGPRVEAWNPMAWARRTRYTAISPAPTMTRRAAATTST